MFIVPASLLCSLPFVPVETYKIGDLNLYRYDNCPQALALPGQISRMIIEYQTDISPANIGYYRKASVNLPEY